MITDDQVEKALNYMAERAIEYSNLVGRCKGLEHRRKVVSSQQFLSSTGTVAERQASAEASDEYRTIINEIEAAETEKALIATHLERARLTIDVWRTQQASNRKGNI